MASRISYDFVIPGGTDTFMHALWAVLIVLIAIIPCACTYPVVIAYMELIGSSLLGRLNDRTTCIFIGVSSGPLYPICFYFAIRRLVY
jgi:hypothetical protein